MLLPTIRTAAAILVLALAGCGAVAPETRSEAPAATATTGHREPDPRASLGDGFAVWESNRTGAFRLWTKRFDGSDLRPLTREDGEARHCCPHLSPDGELLAWVRLAAGQERYPSSADAELHLLDLATGDDRVVAGGARTYHENRAVIWVDDHTLNHIDGDGYSVQLDVVSGARTVLTATARPEAGWLIDATGRWATNGDPSFSRYRPGDRRVVEARPFGGCQPYFSHDGRWGLWTAGAGGPLNRIELATRQVATLLRKHDPRLPADRGYLYFPMLSRAGDLLAFAASHDQHDHFTSDYDVFVVELDPASLELTGTPVRLTDDPATDRYPDVFRPRLPLGRHSGEAPVTLTLEAGGGDGWRWQLGDGTAAVGPTARHTWSEPGIYRLTARRGDTTLAGQVVVRPARPPAIAGIDYRGETTLLVRFDEPIDATGASFTLAGGGALDWRADGDRTVRLDLAAPLVRGAELAISGVRDRAQRPNEMRPERRSLVPPVAWPSDRRDLVFAFETADRDAVALDPASDAMRTVTLTPHGLATLDHDHALVTAGGLWAAPWEAAQAVRAAVQAANELTIEATVTPADRRTAVRGRILTASSGARARNFTLLQYGDGLYLRLRTSTSSHNGHEVLLGRFTERRPVHVLVSYAPGRLAAYLDGRRVLSTGAVQGDFYHWKDRALLVGDEWQGGSAWRGTLEGIAIYARALGPGEAAENQRRYRRRRAARRAIPERRLRATASACSTPATLAGIAPYRRALAVCTWRSGDGELRVAHWSLLDGVDIARPRPGETRDLVLEPWARNPQVAAEVLADTLAEDLDATLYLDVDYSALRAAGDPASR